MDKNCPIIKNLEDTILKFSDFWDTFLPDFLLGPVSVIPVQLVAYRFIHSSRLTCTLFLGRRRITSCSVSSDLFLQIGTQYFFLFLKLKALLY